jgi:hypothetical protein
MFHLPQQHMPILSPIIPVFISAHIDLCSSKTNCQFLEPSNPAQRTVEIDWATEA